MERERNRKGKPWEKERDTGKEGRKGTICSHDLSE